ncbi:response regulator [Paenibacillus sp. sptzw28]|uniref:response regulator n=1 Tax=Paenibacillus sp. sptzw28 TaxID=715179 RepID=UPI001C6F506C|nr:response regulator [Paenibacillus sp. sptzw28]QYR22520.1 response regulator [Paenibacillus sp. sptzw28]
MNVLLVDDEDYVLDYLEEEIQWTSMGITHVYRASCAEEALNITKRVNVSIVLTDIQMPEISGLELLEALKGDYPDAKVILLSGYSEFEYAKKALQHGAADYLLKPVTVEEVTDCLSKVCAQIKTEQRQRDNVSAASDVLKLGITRMREHLLLDLLLGKRYTSEEELGRQLKALNLELQPDQNCVLALIRIETGAEETKREDFELFSYALLNMAEEIFFEKIDEIPSLWSCKDLHRYVAIVFPAHSPGKQPELGRRLASLQQAVQTYMKRTVSIVITHPFAFRHELHRQYLQAVNVFWRLVGTRSGIVLTMNDAEADKELKPLTRLHLSPTLPQLMESGRWEEVTDRLDLILGELDMPPYRTQQHLLEAVYYLFSSFSFMAHKQGDSFADMIDSPALLNDPFYFQSTDKIREWSFSLIEQFKRSLQESAPGPSHVIRQIQDYIERNLQEDVSLTRIGEHVYLHPVYLSRLYKKETGESLSAYISRVRLEKAAGLLMSTNKKVADIAKEVGYQKTQYFIHLFKDYYDCTPQNFRNR